jgi:glutaredoxin
MVANFDDKLWKKQYEQLVEFKRNNGHCRVPMSYQDDKSLWRWVDNQRTAHTKKKMRHDREELLDNIEFVWRVDRAAPWNKQYEKLVEFKRKNGHFLVPFKYQEDLSLGAWVSKQRQLHRKNTIRQDRKGLLDEIGFVWIVDKSAIERTYQDPQWKQKYEKLVEFKRNNGHCLVPSMYQEDKSLGAWVGKQRHTHFNNKLRLDRKVLLDDIGFVWKPLKSDETWHQQYEQLAEFKRKNGHCFQYEKPGELKQKNGHCLVPKRTDKEKSLGNWARMQRHSHSKNKLRLDRKALLDKIGFVWKADKSDKTWHQQYEQLAEFKREKGHCIVPKRYQEDMYLGAWVNNQRQLQRNNNLRLDRKALLDEIGFVWRVVDSRWNKQYEQLVEFKRKNGHCGVPSKCEEDAYLGNWVNNLRQLHSNNKLRLDRKDLLDDIGFVWNMQDRQWHLRYEQLAEFKRKNGHCRVPKMCQEDMSLGDWVDNLRRLHSNNKLRLDRKDLLDDIGFVWNMQDRQWHLRYEQLVELKQKNGHCLVSKRYQEDRYLGAWVSKQRHAHFNNKLRLDRKALLDKIGFVWKADTLAAHSSTSDVSYR